MSVRKAIDELTSEAPVGDLGYPADQRQLALAMLAIQRLADEIDQVKRELAESVAAPERTRFPAATSDPPTAAAGAQIDVGAQLEELTGQLRKLTKAVSKASKKKGR